MENTANIPAELLANKGRFAKSVECGWIGRIDEVETDHDEMVMYKMTGVNDLTLLVAGGKLEDHLEPDDVRWFAPEDVKLLKATLK